MKEIELVKSCKQGDPRAQESLFLRYADKMFRVSLRYVKNRVDTEDVMITGFNRVFSNIQSFQYRNEGSLESWVRRIIINESLMWLRRRHNFNMTQSLDDDQPEAGLGPLSEMQGDDIMKLVDQLPTGYRTVFNLFVVEGYNHTEIGAALDISENTSRSQLFKAKAQLKKILTREGFQYGT